MNRRDLTRYVAAPVALSLAMIGAYFSGVSWLQSIVSPNLELPNPNAAREFGLLENLQHVILAAICVRAILAVKRANDVERRVIFGLIGVAAIFLFLEEIDYGLHYYEVLTNYRTYEHGDIRNIHNMGDTISYMKRAGDAGLIIGFGLAPLLLRRSQNPIIRRYLPSPYAVLTLIAMFLLSSLAHGLQDAGVGTPGNIERNLSEFREFNIYYLGMIYVWDIASRISTDSYDANAD